MPYQHRDSQRAACVSRCWLNPNVFKRAFADQDAVGDTVQRDAARHAQISLAGGLVQMFCSLQNDFFGDRLDRRSQIHVQRFDRCFGFAWFTTEQLMKTRTGHCQAHTIIEKIHVQTKRAVVANFNQVLANQIRIFRFTIGGQSHQLVLARIDSKSTVIGERGVQQTQRVGKTNFVGQFDFVSAADTQRRGRPFADSIHRQNGGFVERRRIKGACRVRLMVFTKTNAALVGTLACRVQTSRNLATQMQFLPRPLRNRFQERSESAWRIAQVGFQQSIKLLKRFFVETNVRQIGWT